ncbi:hypothetical protein ACWDOR_36605 [Streptosporangium canum]
MTGLRPPDGPPSPREGIRRADHRRPRRPHRRRPGSGSVPPADPREIGGVNAPAFSVDLVVVVIVVVVPASIVVVIVVVVVPTSVVVVVIVVVVPASIVVVIVVIVVPASVVIVVVVIVVVPASVVVVIVVIVVVTGPGALLGVVGAPVLRGGAEGCRGGRTSGTGAGGLS